MGGESVQISSGLPRKLEGAKLLLVDDCQDFVWLVERALAPHGARLDCATGLAEARAFVGQAENQSGYDVIIIDALLGDGNGYELVRSLRADGYIRPIVALTGHVTSGQREVATAAGCDAFHSKPISLAALKDVIVSFL